MKAIENVREKANQVINRYGKVIFTFLIFFTLLGTAQVAEAQSGLKIWVRARKKKKRLLSAVTGTCGVTTLLWKKKARIRSNWIAKNLTGKTSKVS